MSNPIKMYHLTTTGDKDEILVNLTEEGAFHVRDTEFRSESGQINGIFVRSNESQQKRLGAMGYAPDSSDIGTEVRPGYPLVATVNCDFGSSWAIDYEESGQLAKNILRQFKDDLLEARPEVFALNRTARLKSISEQTINGWDGLLIEAIDPETGKEQKGFMPWDESMHATEFLQANMALSGRFNDPLEFAKNSLIKEPGLLEAFREHLVIKYGEQMYHIEEQVIRKAIELEQSREDPKDDSRFPTVSLKYVGSKPLPILDIQIKPGSSTQWRKEESNDNDSDPHPITNDYTM